jgi:CheY-like chemotaxis protein
MAEILIIDDEPALREVLSRALRTAGHTGHVAENGAAGIRLFHRLHPALVVTDIVMPEIEGIEVIRKLREADPTVPILAISGSGTPVYLRAAAGMGQPRHWQNLLKSRNSSQWSKGCSAPRCGHRRDPEADCPQPAVGSSVGSR